MSILNFFEHSHKKDNVEYFVHLIHIAKADGIISSNESHLLYRIGKKLGFSDPEIEKLIQTSGKSDYIPPYELYKKFEKVYEIVNMTMADGIIDDREMTLAWSFAIKSGFKESEITALIHLLIEGIKHGKDEEDLFEEFKKVREI